MAMPICALAAAVEPLGRGDVGPALEQLRRHAEREPCGSARSSGDGGMLKSGQIVVGERADGVLVLRARHAQVHKLRAHGFKLRLRLRHVHRGGHAAGKAPLRQVELVLEVGDRVGQAA